MRVSVCNFCSTALEMLRFSSRAILQEAGTTDFDYVVVLWKPSPEVERYVDDLVMAFDGRVHRVDYEGDPDIGYVPNLRAMMNFGLDAGFAMNEWATIVNTDMYFGPFWLSGLVDYLEGPNVAVSSMHITPIKGSAPGIITADFGVPERGKFDMDEFMLVYEVVRGRGYLVPNGRGWHGYQTMPTLFHRTQWEKHGPWELHHLKGDETPDRRFFARMFDGGVQYRLSKESVVYHHEAVERRRDGPPPGAECKGEQR